MQCENSDFPFISVVGQGETWDNLFKPCSTAAGVGCGGGLLCQDVTNYELFGGEGDASGRRYAAPHAGPKGQSHAPSLWKATKLLFARSKHNSASDRSAVPSSLLDAYARIRTSVLSTIDPTRFVSKTTSVITDVVKRAINGKPLDGISSKLRGKGYKRRNHMGEREVPSNLDDDVFDVLIELGLYDSTDTSPGCLPYSQIIANARSFAQTYFPESTVSEDSSYNFCLPPADIFEEDSSDAVEKFIDSTWGIHVHDDCVDFYSTDCLSVPITAWDGAMSSFSSVFDAARLDGSAFLEGPLIPSPASIDADMPAMPMFGSTCHGSAYIQVGNKLAGGISAPGMKKILDFAIGQVMEMQTCRAPLHNLQYIFSRADFMKQFALHTPMSWLSIWTMPPAGREFNVFADTMVNAWNGVRLGMSSLVTKVLGREAGMDDVDIKMDMTSITSCTALDYVKQGCLVQVDVRQLLDMTLDTTLMVGVKQCFSGTSSVPFPTIGVAMKGTSIRALWPFQTCEQTSDCPTDYQCTADVSEFFTHDFPDLYDELIFGGGDRAASCASTKDVDNKMVAQLLTYFTEAETQSASHFAVCLPQSDFDAIPDAVQTGELPSGKTVISFPAMAPHLYTASLPGVNDNRACVIVFPPPDLEVYVWPQATPRLVQWASFSLDLTKKLTLRLMKGASEIPGALLRDAASGRRQLENNIDNTGHVEVSLASSTELGPGFQLVLCNEGTDTMDINNCWKSGVFSIQPAIEGQEAAAEHEMLMPGPSILPGSQVYTVFMAGVKTLTAGLLGVSSHRVEAYDLMQVTVDGATVGVKIYLRILADDTGRDVRTVSELDQKLRDANSQKAFGLCTAPLSLPPSAHVPCPPLCAWCSLREPHLTDGL